MVDQQWPRPTPPSRTSMRPTGGWTGSPPPSAPAPVPAKKKAGTGAVIAVQSAACAVVLLLALLLRLAGGTAYAQLRQSFWDSMQRNDLLQTLAALWDGDPIAAVSDDLQEQNDSAPPAESTPPATGTSVSRLPPEGAVAVALRVNRVAYPPVKSGHITSGYGYRNDPTGTGEQFHKGIDIAAPAGTPIAAMFFGTVGAAGTSDSFGHYVMLEHGDGVQILYAHCAQVLVTEGTVVRAGETVATVGATGDATGDHVHIEIRRNGVVFHPSGIVPVDRYA